MLNNSLLMTKRSENTCGNIPVQQIQVNRRGQRVRERVFRNGGRIISYAMSNTESWARANPPTKQLQAMSLKHVLMPESHSTSPALQLKTLLILCFFLGYIVTFFRRFYEIEDLRISTVSVFMIYLQVPVLNILTWKRFTILSFHVLLIRIK